LVLANANDGPRLRRGVPVHAVSARAGHTKASTTLDMYAHLLGGDDDQAAEQADEMLRSKCQLATGSIEFPRKIASFRNL
jgi:hypothetical protein